MSDKGRKVSRRAARQRAKQIQDLVSNPEPLRAELLEMLADYAPSKVDPGVWVAVSARHRWVMERSGIRGVESFRKHLGVVAGYLAYRHINGLSLAPEDAFTMEEIDRWYVVALAGKSGVDMSKKTCNDYRSRLRNLVGSVNASAPSVRPPTVGYEKVKPGYSAVEEATIRRLALRQSSAVRRRQLCAIVGLCAGAGLSSADLRLLRVKHVEDNGDDGVRVLVPGPSSRVVWVRESYEQLVRIGVASMRPGELVLGKLASRRNITVRIIQECELFGFEGLVAARLRSTWLTWLLHRPVPLPVVLDAAGLTSARTLVALLAGFDDGSVDRHAALRGGES